MVSFTGYASFKPHNVIPEVKKFEVEALAKKVRQDSLSAKEDGSMVMFEDVQGKYHCFTGPNADFLVKPYNALMEKIQTLKDSDICKTMINKFQTTVEKAKEEYKKAYSLPDLKTAEIFPAQSVEKKNLN